MCVMRNVSDCAILPDSTIIDASERCNLNINNYALLFESVCLRISTSNSEGLTKTEAMSYQGLHCLAWFNLLLESGAFNGYCVNLTR